MFSANILWTLEEEIEEKRTELANRKGIVFTTLATSNKLLELGWKVMSHPKYSSDLPPSDYYVFQSLQNLLNGKNFNNNDDL